MEAEDKIRLAEENIRQALRDYGKHTTRTEVLDNVSDAFIRRLAKDNYYAKQELRELFRKSPVWNEELDALVINGTRTHDPDYRRIKDLAYLILEHPEGNRIFSANLILTIKEKLRLYPRLRHWLRKPMHPTRSQLAFSELCVLLWT